MRTLSKGLKRILVFTAVISIISVAYYVYALSVYAPVEESETFLSEVGESFGEIGLWLLLFIYFRTLIKLLLGKGPITKRILPEYSLAFPLGLSWVAGIDLLLKLQRLRAGLSQ